MDKKQYSRAIRREVRRRVKEQVAIRAVEADPQVSLNNATAKVSDTTRSAMSGDVSAIKRHWTTAKMNYANIPMTYAKRLPDKQFRSIDSEIRRMKPGEDVSGLIQRLNRLKVALGRVNLSESRSSEFGSKNPMLVAAAKGFFKKAQAAAKAGDKVAAKRFLLQGEAKLGQTDAGAVSEHPKIGKILSHVKNSLRGNAPGSMAAGQIGLIIKALQQSRVKVR